MSHLYEGLDSLILQKLSPLVEAVDKLIRMLLKESKAKPGDASSQAELLKLEYFTCKFCQTLTSKC